MTAASFRDIAGMAFRNLGRHRVKTIITTTAVAVSVALYIFMDAWILGMNLDSRRNIIAYETGAAKIQTKAYFAKKDELPMYESFGGWKELSAALAKAGYDSAPRFAFAGTLYSRSGTAPMAFNGIEPDTERKLLRYSGFLEAGRFPRPGTFEMAIGTLAADKLRVGLPRRATKAEVEELAAAASTAEDAAFVRSLYVDLKEGVKRSFFGSADEEKLKADAAKLALRKDAPKADLERLWGILAAAGRMDVRISTVIDVKAVPETVGARKFEEDLLPSLKDDARRTVSAAYERQANSGDYRLVETDAAKLETVLAAMTGADFPGAIRHVNQLIDAVVVGVVNAPNPKLNGNIAFMPLGALQDETGLMAHGRVTELLIRKTGAKDERLPGKDESAAAIRAALVESLAAEGKTLPDSLEVHGWRDYVADYLAASNGDNVTTRIMSAFLFILAFIGIANTMLMAILERTKETGMLRALGMTDSQVLLAYVIEAGCVGAIGAIIGIALGCLLNIPMVTHGVDFSAMSKEMGGDIGYRVASLFKSAWNPATVVVTGFAATILSAAAAILPTLRALRMPVTDSLRFE